MIANNKLTAVIAGRTVQGTSHSGDKLVVTFDDGSTMTVLTQGNENSGSTGKLVKAVRQEGTTLAIVFDDDEIWEVPMADETASVMVRAEDHKLEYAD